MEMNGEFQAPAALSPRKEPLVNIGWVLGIDIVAKRKTVPLLRN
jgi:hypothetical protein